MQEIPPDIAPNLFDLFGGTRKMAAHLGEPPSTVNSWKVARRIPASKQPLVLDTAIELNLPVTAEDVIFPMGRGSAEEMAPPSAEGEPA